ncbi:MAG: LysM peptidoglycan-binding protein [Marmoricola sp.]|nr:LysM peptidoglycan-binding protein [Marmoricola sp.]
MGILSDIRVRQPAKGDLVGREFTVAGIGTGFEATIGIRLLNKAGKVLATGSAQSTGGMAAIGEFATRLRVTSPPRAGTPLTLQVFGDNPGPGPGPGSDLREVAVVMYPDLTGWLLYRVESGDTLTGIVRKARDFGRTTVPQILAANDQITDPDKIQTGWRLRIPLS